MKTKTTNSITPGKWRRRPGFLSETTTEIYSKDSRRNPDGSPTAHCLVTSCSRTGKADAKAISALPDVLAALDSLVPHEDLWVDIEVQDERLSKARDALWAAGYRSKPNKPKELRKPRKPQKCS